MRKQYTRQFYSKIETGGRSSARVVVPLILNMTGARSVVDLGCGVGTWLSVFKECGVSDFLGVDGTWIRPEMLAIPADRFVPFDLSRRFCAERAFDLAVSLEVAEHLPESSAASFVDSLTGLAPIVMFSAAIPFQGGTGHVNEQWPEYWAALFADRGYVLVDAIRPAVWSNKDVAPCIAQNVLVFVSADRMKQHDALRRAHKLTNELQLSLVHPGTFLMTAAPTQMSLRRTITALPVVVAAAARRRLDRRRAGPPSVMTGDDRAIR